MASQLPWRLMMLGDGRVVIAFSRQPSVADFLKAILEEAGYQAVACFSTLDDLARAVRDHKPAAIVYEIAFPLVAELDRFRDVRAHRALATVPIVLATPASPDVCKRHGLDRALEVFTRPSRADVERAVQTAIDSQRISDAA